MDDMDPRLYINDAEYVAMYNQLNVIDEAAKDRIVRYRACIQAIINNAIMEGYTKQNLKTFLDGTQALEQIVHTPFNNIKWGIDAYLFEIENKDKWIY